MDKGKIRILTAIIYFIGILIIPMALSFNFVYDSESASGVSYSRMLAVHMGPWNFGWSAPTLFYLLYRLEKYLYLRMKGGWVAKFVCIIASLVMLGLAFLTLYIAMMLGICINVPLVSIITWFAVVNFIPLLLLIPGLCDSKMRLMILGYSLLIMMPFLYFISSLPDF